MEFPLVCKAKPRAADTGNGVFKRCFKSKFRRQAAIGLQWLGFISLAGQRCVQKTGYALEIAFDLLAAGDFLDGANGCRSAHPDETGIVFSKGLGQLRETSIGDTRQVRGGASGVAVG